MTEITKHSDPLVPQWAEMQLPNTWPDRLDFKNPKDIIQFVRYIIGKKRHQVQIPENLPGRVNLPKYIMQEFHNLPNGNYSNKITRGYSRGFDIVMLGKMKRARKQIAAWLTQSETVLDVGCGGGQMAAALKKEGINDVWGLDPSAYLLKHAAHDYPGINFIQGIAENTGFANERFDGLSACFLMHEIPPRYLHQALSEYFRILKPNGLLAICEPSIVHYESSQLQLLKSYGITGPYFKWLSHFVFEPFVKAWHELNIEKLLSEHGFNVMLNDKSMPFHYILAQKKS